MKDKLISITGMNQERAKDFVENTENWCEEKQNR